MTEKYIEFPNTPFKVRTSSLANKPGQWYSTLVEIFKDDIMMGEYVRNYHGHCFYPFLNDGIWYALYSKDYTALRVCKLEDQFEDWCGEEPSSYGFCPVELYVPEYVVVNRPTDDEKKKYSENFYVYDNRGDINEYYDKCINETKSVSRSHAPFGFYSGCVWGDDSSWKIRYIDLRKIKDKRLIIEDKFGYCEQSDNLTLKESINLSGKTYSLDADSYTITEQIFYDKDNIKKRHDIFEQTLMKQLYDLVQLKKPNITYKFMGKDRILYENETFEVFERRNHFDADKLIELIEQLK